MLEKESMIVTRKDLVDKQINKEVVRLIKHKNIERRKIVYNKNLKILEEILQVKNEILVVQPMNTHLVPK